MQENVSPAPRELILLSPYRVPGQNALYLGNDDMACFLNGYTALWHPAAARGAASPPRAASPYDHEQPTAGHVYAIPDSPPLILPDDWDQRVKDAGAVTFRAVADRATTLANLKEALRNQPAFAAASGGLLDLPDDQAAPFFGLGFGYAMVEALFEAMEHENLMATSDLWLDVQAAVAALAREGGGSPPPGGEGTPEGPPVLTHLKAAAQRLVTAREVLYPTTIHLIDIATLDERRLGDPFPAGFDLGLPLNLIASGELLEKLARDHPDRLAALRERVAGDRLDVCGGCYQEREDALMPVASQLWNLQKGLAVSKEVLQQEVRVFARKRFGFHPQTPLLLTGVGLTRALFLVFDESVLPSHRATVINWPSPGGKQVEAFTRAPNPADSPQTFFHAAHYLHRTIMQDHAATFALLHGAKPAGPWYRDWLELSKLGPVLGEWRTLTRYFNEVLAGEYTSAAAADEFHGDYLSERTGANPGAEGTAPSPAPVSWFARQVRWRRRIDTAWTLAALYRGLVGKSDELKVDERLAQLEDQVETAGAALASPQPEFAGALGELEQKVAEALATRLVSRGTPNNPGFLVLNPCSFTRRLALELDGVTGTLPLTGPLKACQVEGNVAKVVVEVPALGFAWIPRSGGTAGPAPAARMKLADERGVRNEFFEAEIDPTTGGLRAIRDHKSRINRLAQQLVYNPGSTTRVKSVKVTSTGPAVGEVVSEGALLDAQQKVLATFRQRFRAWLGRPVLDLRIEIYPEHAPQGYPWHAYYGARFAWRDERATLLRGVNGTGYITTHTRPESPDYLEFRIQRESTVLFPAGLPFHQKHGARMADVILLPEGETARAFDLAVGLDRDYPMQSALGMVTPVPVVPTTQGPPHVGASGWLFHLDSPNLLLLGMRPAPDGADGVVARLLECGGHGGQAELRCVRDPQRATLLDVRGNQIHGAYPGGDAVSFEMSMGDLADLRVDFG